MWVWVDGDVRAKLTVHSGKEPDGPILEMDVIDFPEELRALASDRNGALFVEHEEEEWAVKPKKVTASTAQLPRSLAGLTLGMSKAQILAVYPGAEIKGIYGSYRLRNGNEVNFHYNYVDDQLYDITRIRYDESEEEILARRKSLTEEFGPAYCPFLASVSNSDKPPSFDAYWDDGTTRLSLSLAFPSNTSHPESLVTISDMPLAKLTQNKFDQDARKYKEDLERDMGTEALEKHYKECPSDHSFFLPEDLNTSKR